MPLGYCRECGGKASTEAPACPHCGAENPTGRYHPAPPQPVYVRAVHRPSDGIAAVLSLFIPGAGQIYKGKVLGGIGWMVATFIGYLALVLPGLVLHLVCIINAATTEPA